MILADSSVWIDHLRKGDPLLADLLLREQIVMHTMILGELACGSLKDRERVLVLWRRLPCWRPRATRSPCSFWNAIG